MTVVEVLKNSGVLDKLQEGRHYWRHTIFMAPFFKTNTDAYLQFVQYLISVVFVQ